MGKVSASSSIVVAATPERTLEAVTDYVTVRPRILTDRYSEYRVAEGGTGAGTVAEWAFAARSGKPPRQVRAQVAVSGNTVTETDANSSMVTTWTLAPSGSGTSVTTTTEWNGAGGIGGFFEKTFAPKGLARVQQEVLANLAKELA
ncbi:MAG: SRPBCC family protein [Mycobacteriaceae bacterium]|nr:SRPBCC family protein [Mycobacteriaceae bacterium]